MSKKEKEISNREFLKIIKELLKNTCANKFDDYNPKKVVNNNTDTHYRFTILYYSPSKKDYRKSEINFPKTVTREDVTRVLANTIADYQKKK